MGSQEEAVGPRGGELQVGEERQREELLCELGAAVDRALHGGGDRALGRAIVTAERILCHGSTQASGYIIHQEFKQISNTCHLSYLEGLCSTVNR